MNFRNGVFPRIKSLKPGGLLAVGTAVLVLLLAGCSGRDTLQYKDRTVEEIYDWAMGYMEKGQYRYAAVAFDEVERQHPYSSWARRAQLMSAYAYYMANKYEEAILAAERFISLHPGNKDVAYAYYLVGISYYEQIADVRRDQKTTEQALAALAEVVRRFPQSEYARDARLKIDLAQDHLAGKEMEVGRFYQKTGEFMAAINRYKTVVEKYQTTSHVPEALHRMVEVYLSLGIIPEAQKAAAVLGYNYPKSKWYARSYDLMQQYGNK
ncbi:outer membrane protein assembly factor BamD [Luteithermobacter gelatinilyticus]|uniref:outer membrane protein assembly factor BamD n=1 Tax=Luteithermobacter gelatinilyticus TaxID=2582913 RepID=UPI001105D8F1|nr:outer membrane protein assembly factor BamD [Luteithermobacter gelatinilyticus]